MLDPRSRGLFTIQPLSLAVSRESFDMLTDLGLERGFPEPPEDRPGLIAEMLVSIGVKWYYDGMPIASRPLHCGPLSPFHIVTASQKPEENCRLTTAILEMHWRALSDEAQMTNRESTSELARPIASSFAGALASKKVCALVAVGHHLDVRGPNRYEHLFSSNVHDLCDEYDRQPRPIPPLE